jgi:hypothetical protein
MKGNFLFVTPKILGYKTFFALYSKFYVLPYLFFTFLFPLLKQYRVILIYVGVSPRSVMVVAFMLLHSVSKCKKCLKHVIGLVEVSHNFSYFSE